MQAVKKFAIELVQAATITALVFGPMFYYIAKHP